MITKLDLMDKGTDAMDVLSGATLPVKLGIIGIVNRGFSETEVTMEEITKKEREFLKQNYSKIAEQNGCPYLSQTLSNVS